MIHPDSIPLAEDAADHFAEIRKDVEEAKRIVDRRYDQLEAEEAVRHYNEGACNAVMKEFWKRPSPTWEQRMAEALREIRRCANTNSMEGVRRALRRVEE